jgi:CRP-like cAMP-binding protein
LFRTGRTGIRVVGRVGAGGVVGDLSIFRGGPATSSARAAEDVVALRIDRRKVVPLWVAHPSVAVRWLVAGLGELETAQRGVLMLHGSVKEQLAELLLAEAGGDGEVRASQATIAAILGASRQSINEALADLRRSGLVATGYRAVHVLDPARLHALAYPRGPADG